MTRPVAVIFAGGDAPPSVAAVPRDPALVIAADSGMEHALANGASVDLLIGDLDSISDAALAEAEHLGIEVERHPGDKDATDLELALEAAVARGAGRIVVVGGHGGRLDHQLANLAVLASDRFSGASVEAIMGEAHVYVVRSEVRFDGRVGDLVSLLPVAGDCSGVSTAGLRFPLGDETLHVGSSRGVSNEMSATTATVRVAGGKLLVVHQSAATQSEGG